MSGCITEKTISLPLVAESMGSSQDGRITCCPDCGNPQFTERQKNPTYRCVKCGHEFENPDEREPNRRVFSDDDILDALHQADKDVEGKLTMRKYGLWVDNQEDVYPKESTVKSRFSGSALEEAGIEPHRSTTPIESLTRAVFRIRCIEGEYPSSSHYEDRREPGDPSYTVIYNSPTVPDTWSAFIDEMEGLRDPLGEFYAALYRIQTEQEEYPTEEQYEEYREESEPSGAILYNGTDCPCDSWEDLIQMLEDFEPGINAIQSAAEQLDKSPTYAEYQSLDLTPSLKQIHEDFGTFSRAKLAAGVGDTKAGYEYTTLEMADAIETVDSRTSELLTQPRYNQLRDDDHPDADVIYNRTGSFADFRDSVLNERLDREFTG